MHNKNLVLVFLICLMVAIAALLKPAPAGGEPDPMPPASGRLSSKQRPAVITVSEPDMVIAAAAEAGRRQQEADIAAYFAALEEVRQQQRAAAPTVTQVAPQGFDYPAECSGHPVPAYIVWRESHCNYGAVNVTGCGGWSCVGMYQFDLRHWLTPEQGGWGGCAWLGDWTVPANQDACADQMSRGGTNLSAWGF